jgi:hypothetical protein
MRCLIISGVASQSSDGNTAQAGKYSSVYWMGRVNGATPNANLVQQLGTVAKALKGVNLQAEAERCGEEMKRRGLQMQEAGKALQAQAAQPAK